MLVFIETSPSCQQFLSSPSSQNVLIRPAMLLVWGHVPDCRMVPLCVIESHKPLT